MGKVMTLQPKNKSVFNPSSNYKWEPSDIFEITGQQLASLYHCLNREINLPEGSPISLKYEAFQVVMDIFKMGVEQGVIVENDSIPKTAEVEQSVNNLFGKKEQGFEPSDLS